jgi:hypothetical protein
MNKIFDSDPLWLDAVYCHLSCNYSLKFILGVYPMPSITASVNSRWLVRWVNRIDDRSKWNYDRMVSRRMEAPIQRVELSRQEHNVEPCFLTL